MKEIIRALFMEGYKAKDILAVTRYINENYDIVEGDVISFQKKKEVSDAQKEVDKIALEAQRLMSKHADSCTTRNGSIIGPAEHVNPLVNHMKKAIKARENLETAKNKNNMVDGNN